MVIARFRVAGNKLNSIGMVRNRKNAVTTYFSILSKTRTKSIICLVLRSLIFLMTKGLNFSLPVSDALRERELNSFQSSQSRKASATIIASAIPNLMKKPHLDAASSIAVCSTGYFLAAGAAGEASLAATSGTGASASRTSLASTPGALSGVSS